MAEEDGRGHRAGTVPAWPATPSIVDAEVAVVGAGAAGLYAALTAARAGRARRARLAPRRWRRPRATGPRAASPPRSRADDSPDLHREDTERAGRGLVRRSAAAAALPRGAARRARARGARRALRRRPRRRPRPRPRGRPLAPPRRARRRQRDRPPRRAPAQRRRRRGAAHRGPRAGRAPARCGRVDGRCVGVVLEDGRAVRARATVLATGGAAALWARTTNPPGSLGIGLMLAHARRRRAGRPRVRAVPPHRGDRRAGARGLPGDRGDPRRGRDAARRRRRALRRGARAARRGVARDRRRRCASTGVPNVWLDMRARRPARCSPTSSGALRESGLDPATELIPVSPAAHYCMGGVVADLDGALDASPASTPSARPRAPACTAPTAWRPTR